MLALIISLLFSPGGADGNEEDTFVKEGGKSVEATFEGAG
jgi:hypothetical protein